MNNSLKYLAYVDFTYMKSLHNYKYVVVILSSFLILSCQPQQEKQAKKNFTKATPATVVSNDEEQAINLIMALEEIKRKSAQVEKDSHGKRHLATYAETMPTATDPNYWIKVAEDNGGSYVTYYTFAVNSKTRKISYYDPMQDSLISLDQWRKIPMAER
jgi:ribosomal protein S15P/S13E